MIYGSGMIIRRWDPVARAFEPGGWRLRRAALAYVGRGPADERLKRGIFFASSMGMQDEQHELAAEIVKRLRDEQHALVS